MTADLTITFADEAWEWMYELLSSWADKQLTVDVNGATYELVGLTEGYTSEGAQLLAHPWDDATNLPSTDIVRIPLFDEAGIVTITKLHLH